MRYSFFIPLEPKAKQSTNIGKSFGNGRTMAFTDPKVKKYQADIRAIVLNQLRRNYPGHNMLVGPLVVYKLDFRFKPLQGHTKLEKIALSTVGFIPKTTKPDLPDNLSKPLFDALNGLIFHDDAQICEMHQVRKVYAPTFGILLEIGELRDSNAQIELEIGTNK